MDLVKQATKQKLLICLTEFKNKFKEFLKRISAGWIPPELQIKLDLESNLIKHFKRLLLLQKTIGVDYILRHKRQSLH